MQKPAFPRYTVVVEAFSYDEGIRFQGRVHIEVPLEDEESDDGWYWERGILVEAGPMWESFEGGYAWGRGYIASAPPAKVAAEVTP